MHQKSFLGLTAQLCSLVAICKLTTVWGGRLRKRFRNMFSGSSPFLARVAWQLQFSPTACGTLRKRVTKPFPQPAAPDCISMTGGGGLRLDFVDFDSGVPLTFFICLAISTLPKQNLVDRGLKFRQITTNHKKSTLCFPTICRNFPPLQSRTVFPINRASWTSA